MIRGLYLVIRNKINKIRLAYTLPMREAFWIGARLGCQVSKSEDGSCKEADKIDDFVDQKAKTIEKEIRWLSI